MKQRQALPRRLNRLKPFAVMLLWLFMLGSFPWPAQADEYVNNLARQEKPTAPAPALADINQGKLRYQATLMDHNLTIGDYQLQWSISPSQYTINTSLLPSGLVRLFVSYRLQEQSTGRVEQGQLNWRRYEIQQIESDAQKPYSFEFAERVDGTHINLNGKITAIEQKPLDLPSAFITLMKAMMAEELPSDWQQRLNLITSSTQVEVLMKRQADEQIHVPAGDFDTRVLLGETSGAGDKMFLHLWYAQDQHYPVRMIFSNSKGQKFLINLVKVL